ncbi:MAG: hypothetical protein KDC26_00350 [Armatimonadetes bacterium]|nr:hypothetical protein [Armatimonadota bacterium]
MDSLFNVLLILGGLVAVVLIGIVMVTGKGDAMSGGGGSVRTTFKGKASFDDKISQFILILGLSLMAILLVANIILNQTTV